MRRWRGHLVAVSHDVGSAMEGAVRNKFDLLIRDIALPDSTGMDLFMQLREIADVRGLRSVGLAIMVTSKGVCRPVFPSISPNPLSSTTRGRDRTGAQRDMILLRLLRR